ncbi:hypothetical protein LZ480_16235 [Solibacillus sp. MA9]|uniref:Lipoprotein n=1 Tax=Solibacillus palustris TaxID=2908203 RepID=A0ABS9UHL8_9BACL|nr:hypothetical protein [Solibacillus sp. MA9]MCH7323425.1 hypothetical protein [Solibacillus sp. MA9]
MIEIKRLLATGIALSAILLGACNGESRFEKVQAEVINEQEKTNLPVAEYTNFLVTEEQALEKMIANESGLEKESISVNLTPISPGEIVKIVCVIFLPIEHKLDMTMEQQIKNNIMTAVSDIKNVELSEKYIIFTNLKK